MCAAPSVAKPFAERDARAQRHWRVDREQLAGSLDYACGIGEDDRFVDGALSGNFPLALAMLPIAEQTVYQEELHRRLKSLGVAYLYFALLGVFGGQKFYINEPLWGTLYLCCSLMLIGLACAAGIVGFSLAVINNIDAPNTGLLLSMVVVAFCIITLAVSLLFDLLLIPGQVSRANDKIRKQILVEIAHRLYPNTYIPPVAQNFAFNTVGKGLAVVLVSFAVLVAGIFNGLRSSTKTAREDQTVGDTVSKKRPSILVAASLMSGAGVSVAPQEKNGPEQTFESSTPSTTLFEATAQPRAPEYSGGKDDQTSTDKQTGLHEQSDQRDQELLRQPKTAKEGSSNNDESGEDKGKNQDQNRRQQVGSVGVLVSYKTGKIKQIYPESDLAEVACSPGDRIIAVDGEPLPADQLHSALIGKPGKYVTLLVRQENGEEIEYEVQLKQANLFPRQPD
jgi:TM2 domain-containing membrane protein YozV